MSLSWIRQTCAEVGASLDDDDGNGGAAAFLLAVCQVALLFRQHFRSTLRYWPMVSMQTRLYALVYSLFATLFRPPLQVTKAFVRELSTRAVHSVAQHEERLRRAKAANRKATVAKAAAGSSAAEAEPGAIKPEAAGQAVGGDSVMETDDVSDVLLEDWQVSGGLVVPLQVYHAITSTPRFDFLSNAYMGALPFSR